jgi:hypothetical protein
MASQDALRKVEHELQREKKLRFHGSRFRIGPLDLTHLDGRLTDFGKAFMELRSNESLDHYDRSSERLTSSQVLVTDVNRVERMVARMIDGVMLPTHRGLAYYKVAAPTFEVTAPAWRPRFDGEDIIAQYARTMVPITDNWLRGEPDGERLVASFRQLTGQSDPDAFKR